MAADSQRIVIAGFSLIYPLLQLLETLEADSPAEPNEVQTGAWENGYAAAIVVLSVFILESAINRVCYFEEKEKEKESCKPEAEPVHEKERRKPGAAQYFASRHPKLAEPVHEVFALRDIIVHSHVWDVQTDRVPGKGLKFVESPEIRQGYGDKRFKEVMDPESRLSRHLGLNCFPSRIWRHDAHIVLRTVKHALMALDSMNPTCNELITSAALLDNSVLSLLGFGENETDLLLRLPENELTIIEKSLQTSVSAHIQALAHFW